MNSIRRGETERLDTRQEGSFGVPGLWLLACVVSCLVACNAPTSDGLFIPLVMGGNGGEAAGGSAGAGTGGSAGSSNGGGAGALADAGGVSGAGGNLGGMGGTAQRDSAAGGEAGATDGGVEAGRACAGTLVGGLCFYLGAVGQSCDTTCDAHAGFDAASVGVLGTTAQGGSAEECSAILTALLGNANETVMATTDDVGLGCHVFGQEPKRWWLAGPAFSADARLDSARIACACND